MTLPDPATFTSGSSGSVAGRRMRLAAGARDLALDVRLRAAGAGRALDRLDVPRRSVYVLSIYRPGGGRLPHELPKLRDSRHDVRVALGALGPAAEALESETVAAELTGGKFPNLNVVGSGGGVDADWTLVIDDDVELPPRFLDRFIAACEHFDLAIAQPAQSHTSHAAWPVTRRRAGSLARETRFVEIGPVTAFRRDAAAELMPFPELRFGWGLDLHWSAVAAERGRRLGIVDALPVRHSHAPVASSYSWEEATDEAQRFLAGKPYVDARSAGETLTTHRTL